MKQTALLASLVSLCAAQPSRLLEAAVPGPVAGGAPAAVRERPPGSALNPPPARAASQNQPALHDPLTAEPSAKWRQQIHWAHSLVETGDLDQAEAVYLGVLEQAESDGDDPVAAVVLQNLGRLLDRRGLLRQAEKAYLRAIQAFTRSGVSDDRFVARLYAGLPAVYIQMGQYSKAEALIRSMLADHPAATDSDKASLLGNLGVILAHKRRSEEAEHVLRQTAELCVNASSPELREVGAIAVANMAGIQMRGGRAAEAAASYRQALAIMEALPRPSPTTLAVTLSDYAGVLRGMGDRNAAEGLYRQAMAVAEERLGSAHPILGGLFQSYAQLMRDTGRKSEARGFDAAARRIRDESERENLTGHTVEFQALSAGR